MNKVILYTPILSNRFRYIVSELLQRMLSFEVQMTTSKEDFLMSSSVRINYSDTAISQQELHIVPQGLLFETQIDATASQFLPLKPPIGDRFMAYCTPNINASKGITLSEDIFANSFFLLSRYEEYLPFQADVHGRFSAKNSIAFRQGFLHRPLINEWVLALAKLLQQVFPAFHFQQPTFEQYFTYDIDIAYKYLHRAWWRTIGASIKDWRNRERWQVLTHQQADPFEVFDYLFTLHRQHPNAVRCFFLLADYDTFDKNIDYKNADFQKLIKKIAQHFSVGIHPSYSSNEHKMLLQKEVERLSQIAGQTITSSRQHFLKLRFPDTYQHLLSVGIKADYSMGYADEVGFRASVCTPFYWYNLVEDTPTDLLIYPFQAMDVTMKDYLKWSPETAAIQLQNIKKTVQQVGGQFVTLWHNSSFDSNWEKWIPMYEAFVNP